ncbi:hypothetical protein M514_27191 [Trichuris suis]|uniref:Uncharacterized protein n=1 Tax=Trichuris suis TaxID=68888 RepID=A0A085MTS2_9BILA|nr:hypothetical protein M513_11674 [Trichuris suis]KFD47451.1 hypothetical protein M513_11676 [Trichuris suis]KFD60618.1 hypothetical protein M514_27191 [Trichuris suis]
MAESRSASGIVGPLVNSMPRIEKQSVKASLELLATGKGSMVTAKRLPFQPLSRKNMVYSSGRIVKVVGSTHRSVDVDEISY